MPASVQLRKERSISDVLNVTFRFIRDTWKILLKSLLYLTAPIYLVGVAAMVVGYLPLLEPFMEASLSPGSSPPTPDVDVSTVIAVPIMFVTFLVGGAVATTSILGIVRLYDERDGGAFEVNDVWNVVKQRTGTVILITLLISVTLMIASPLAIIPCFGFIVLLTLVVFLFAKYFFIGLPVAVIEDEGALASLGRAGSLSENHVWATLGIVVIAYVAVSVLSTIFSLPMYAAMFAGVMFGGESGDLGIIGGAVSFLTLLVSFGGSLLLTSLIYVAGAMQYYNLVERKEQASLQSRVAEMEANAATAEPDDQEPASAGPRDAGETEESADDSAEDSSSEDTSSDEDASDDASRWGRSRGDDAAS